MNTLPCNCAAQQALAEIRRVLGSLPTDGDGLDLLDAARERLGTDSAVADALGVGRSVVGQWRARGKVPRGRWKALASLATKDLLEVSYEP